ncbi:hypothetical protein E1301_Tti018221 [Triplophysa tibetana]|uniref:Immunoglobulin domain-containing protein n=1 Tax=Triplophysa tibetana TaxID=1572043 RepID=A0A5A9NSF9_9TELE|nr:hypothetical protein E1301_Tti018221 [Triplophysa tibetana]
MNEITRKDLFTCYQNVQTLTHQVTELGQHVTINCDLDEVDEVYWLLLNLPNPPVTILRTFLTSQTPFYYDMKFRDKYSLQSKHLIINSVTKDELGVYFCMNTGIFPIFSDGIRLHVIGGDTEQ